MMKDQRFRIKRHVIVIPHNANEVELATSVWQPNTFIIKDCNMKNKLYKIIKLLDGNNTIAEISKKNNIPRDEVEGIIEKLKVANVVEDRASNIVDYYVDNMHALYQSSRNVEQFCRDVIIVGDKKLQEILCDILRKTFPNKSFIADRKKIDLLEKFNEEKSAMNHEKFLRKFSDWKNCLIVFVNQYINPDVLITFNKVAEDLNIQWFNAGLDGPFLHVGPLFNNAEGPCYECLENQFLISSRHSEYYLKYKKKLMSGLNLNSETANSLTPLYMLLCSFVALEVSNFIATGNSLLEDKIFSIYLPTMEMSYHTMTKVQGCSV
nr:TOMM precursor leader peptide-binding protein [Pseudomonadota bacterium]